MYWSHLFKPKKCKRGGGSKEALAVNWGESTKMVRGDIAFKKKNVGQYSSVWNDYGMETHVFPDRVGILNI